MNIQVNQLRPNPFRRIDAYPINREKVESLKASIDETSFWNNILVRPVKDGYEVAYGHHRLVALQELGVIDIEAPVKAIDDGLMFKIMANENRDSYKANRSVTIETVRVARDWLREQMEGGWDSADKSISGLFKDAHAFNTCKAQGVGRDLIKKFLGKDWKEWEIQDALSQMEETDKFDPAALEPFEKLAVATEAKNAMTAYKIPKHRQKAVVKMLVKKDVSVQRLRK